MFTPESWNIPNVSTYCLQPRKRKYNHLHPLPRQAWLKHTISPEPHLPRMCIQSKNLVFPKSAIQHIMQSQQILQVLESIFEFRLRKLKEVCFKVINVFLIDQQESLSLNICSVNIYSIGLKMTQYFTKEFTLVISYNGKESETNIHIYLYLHLVGVHQKVTQCCKSTVLR